MATYVANTGVSASGTTVAPAIDISVYSSNGGSITLKIKAGLKRIQGSKSWYATGTLKIRSSNFNNVVSSKTLDSWITDNDIHWYSTAYRTIQRSHSSFNIYELVTYGENNTSDPYAVGVGGDSSNPNTSHTYTISARTKYTITYKPNGGSGSITSSTYTQKWYGESLKLPRASNGISRTNFKLLGWSKTSTATTATYAEGGTYPKDNNSSATLYATWQKLYTSPKLTDIAMYRTKATSVGSSDPTADPEGTRVFVKFTYTNGSVASGGTTVGTLNYKIINSYTNVVYAGPTSVSGTTGTVKIILTQECSVNTGFNFVIHLYNSNYTSYEVTAAKLIPSTRYIFDLEPTARTLGILRAAPETVGDVQPTSGIYCGSSIRLPAGSAIAFDAVATSNYKEMPRIFNGSRDGGGTYWDCLYYCAGVRTSSSNKFHMFRIGQPSSSSDTSKNRFVIRNDRVATLNSTPFTSAGKLTVSSGGIEVTGSSIYHNTITMGSNIIMPNGISVQGKNSGGTNSYPLIYASSNNNIVIGDSSWNDCYIHCIYGSSTGSVSNAPNVYVTTAHRLVYTTHSNSSIRYKHDIKDVTNAELDPHRLYGIEIKQFKYNDDVITDKTDCRYGKDLIGFMAEQVRECYPVAVDVNDKGECEGWSPQYIVPPMLALVQEQHKEIEELKKRVKKLEEIIEKKDL